MLKKLFNLITIFFDFCKKQIVEFTSLFTRNKLIREYENQYDQLQIRLALLEKEYSSLNKRTRNAQRIKLEINHIAREMDAILYDIQQLKPNGISQN